MLVSVLLSLNAWLLSYLESQCLFVSGRKCSSALRSIFSAFTRNYDLSDLLRFSSRRSPGGAIFWVFFKLSIQGVSYFRNRFRHVDIFTVALTGSSSMKSASRRCHPRRHEIGRFFGISFQTQLKPVDYGSCRKKTSMQCILC